MLYISEQTWHDLQSDIVYPVLFEDLNKTAYKLINAGIDVLLVNEEKQVIGKFIIKDEVVVLKYENI